MDTGVFEVIGSKLRHLGEYLEELETFLPPNAAAYVASRPIQLQVERLCQLIVECADDLNAALLVGLDEPPPSSCREGFRALADRKRLTEEIADRFYYTHCPFRNRLVHDYEKLDNSIVHHTASRLITDGRNYFAQMQALIASRCPSDTRCATEPP